MSTTSRIILESSVEALSRRAAESIWSVIQAAPSTQTVRFLLPAGRSPEETYAALGPLLSETDRKRLHAHFLDEYIGLAEDHPCSFKSYAQKVLAILRLPTSQVEVFSTRADVARVEAAEFEKRIAHEQYAVAFLGIGPEGHIAFNMPGSAFDSQTRIVNLTEETRRANAGAFGGDWKAVPERAVTMGIGTILKAKKIFLIATGAGKAKAVQAAIEGPRTKQVPASALQQHPDVTFFLDQAASSLISQLK